MEDINAIQEILQAIPYGDVSFTVYRHDNKTRNIVAQEFRNILFPNNEDAVKWLLMLCKTIVDKKLSGTTSFTISYHEGQIKKATEQSYEQHLLDKTLKK